MARRKACETLKEELVDKAVLVEDKGVLVDVEEAMVQGPLLVARLRELPFCLCLAAGFGLRSYGCEALTREGRTTDEQKKTKIDPEAGPIRPRMRRCIACSRNQMRNVMRLQSRMIGSDYVNVPQTLEASDERCKFKITNADCNGSNQALRT